jgi:hypothetical protein
MNNRILKAFLVLGSAAALSACSTSIRDNPCLVWIADNGTYLVKYTAKTPADACVATQGLDGQFADLAVNLYPQPDKSTVALLPPEVVDVATDGMRDPAVTLAVGEFDNGGGAVDDKCAVPTLTEASNVDGSVKYQYSNLNFLEDASTQGLAFQGDVSITTAGCTTDYSFVAMAPGIGCETGDDCIPIPDPGQGRFFGAPLSPAIQTQCENDAATQTYLGTNEIGICFFANEFPSFCPEGSLSGDANCPVL